MAIFDLLTHGVHLILEQLYQHTGQNWGTAIIALAVLTRVILYPVGRVVSTYQQQVSKYQALLEPELINIKKQYKGEEAHHRIMDAHKALGISPFFTLKPMIGLLFQIPILVIVFNALADMPQLEHATFGWISDLSKPDIIIPFSTSLFYLGEGIHLLPLLMTAISVVSTYFYKNPIAPAQAAKQEKRNVYFMAFMFLILFYPFPASMVLYWTTMNLLQFMQQIFTGTKGV